MDRIDLNKAFTAVIEIPESQIGDTVTYKIYKASDGSIFTQGSGTFIAGINWKVIFTPSSEDVYIVEVKDETLDITYSQSFQAQAAEVVNEDDQEPTTQELLTAVNKAIKARLAGGAVQAYTIGGRNLQYMTINDLYNLRDKLKAEVNIQNGPARTQGGFGRGQSRSYDCT